MTCFTCIALSQKMQAACFQGCGLGSPCRRENIVFIIYLIMYLFIHLYFCVIYTDNPCRRDYIKVLNDNVCILYMPKKRFIYKQCTLQKGKYTIATIFFSGHGRVLQQTYGHQCRMDKT